MKIKIIDLFNKIANNVKVPKKIKFRGETYYYSKPDKFYYCDGYSIYRKLSFITNSLNAEVEIIEEEKEIEKIGKIYDGFTDSYYDTCLETAIKKVDELVDEINKLKKEIEKENR